MPETDGMVANRQENPFVRRSLLQESASGRARCNVCERRCRVVPGGWGWCRSRQNRDGTLMTLIYGAVSSLAVNPVEKKPFYHLRPGSLTLTAGSWSCNFGCTWCQNWDISKARPPASGQYVSPERFVELAESNGCQGTSISFNEPTLSLEWALEVFPLARRRGLYNTFVTNGYMTPESLSLLIDAGLDAMNVDMKGDAASVRKHCRGIDVQKVWSACRAARARGVHVEITTLVIPGVSDADAALREIARRILEIGAEIPWHATAYHPAYQFAAPPTPPSALERAWRIGRDAGLNFVYTGNVPGRSHSDTYCPGCNALLIRRSGFDVLSNELREGRCSRCGQIIAGLWGDR